MTATETGLDLPPRLLVIDLENSVGTVRPRQRQFRAKVAALLAAAGPVHHAVAGYASDTEEDPIASLLAELGVAPLRTAPGPDAAEQVLLAHARRVHDSLGCRHFLVASGDRKFSELAGLGRLELLVWDDQPVAAKLTDVAHDVRRLARPTGGTDAGLADQRQEDLEPDQNSGPGAEPQDAQSLDGKSHWPFGRVMPRAARVTALRYYVAAYHRDPKLRLWPALMTPTSLRTVVGLAGDTWMSPHDFLIFAGERGVQVVYGGFLDDGPDDEPVPFEQGLVLQYLQPSGVVHCWTAVSLDDTAWAGARAHWGHRTAAPPTWDGEVDGLVRGAGCVAISASCLDWALGYLIHAMRGWDDATLNSAMGRPGHVWQEFSRLVDELHPMLGEDLVELRDTVQRLREERHQVVHAVWMRTPGVPGVPDSYEAWHPRTDTSRPVTAEGLLELAQRLGQGCVEVQALTTALLNRATEDPQP